MKMYYVFDHPKYGERIEPEGFSFLAFLFPVFWLFAKKMYKLAFSVLFLTAVAIFGFNFLTGFIDSKINSILYTSQEVLNEVPRYKDIYWQLVNPNYESLSTNEKLAKATTIYAEEQAKAYEVLASLIFIILFGFKILIGCKGRQWLLNSLKNRGFDQVAFMDAHNKDAVIAILAKERASARA